VSDAERLRQSLLTDAGNYYYSALVSFFDGFLDLDRHLYTWSTVKLYYSVFYTLRGLLALKGHCIYYCNGKPFSCSGDVVGVPSVVRKDSTHKVVLNLFGEAFAEDRLLSQPIAGEPALDWLVDRREEANYKQGRFPDPDVPAHFIQVTQLGFRRAINAYLADPSLFYAFDADHAMVAFPLATLMRLRAELRSQNLQVDTKGRKFLSALGRDKGGRIAGLDQLF
jgi:uncharacterized protein (UPF0332 family)